MEADFQVFSSLLQQELITKFFQEILSKTLSNFQVFWSKYTQTYKNRNKWRYDKWNQTLLIEEIGITQSKQTIDDKKNFQEILTLELFG